MTKTYFSHYGEVVSLSKEDALNLCEKAMLGSYNLMEYPTARRLKSKTVKRENPYIRIGFKTVTVNCCLDWEKWEWESLLNELKKD